MVVAVVTVCSGHTLKASDLPNRLFNHDAKLRKRPIGRGQRVPHQPAQSARAVNYPKLIDSVRPQKRCHKAALGNKR